MLKKFLALLVMLYAAASFAAVDVNKASAADLDSVKGIGPAISGRIIDERKNGSFKDWSDLISRVKGIGEKSAAHFSDNGLTVNGAGYKGAAPAKASKADKTDKPGQVDKADGKDAKADKKSKKKSDKKDASAAK